MTLHPGATQSMELLRNIPILQMSHAMVSTREKIIPLSSFNFSCSLGIQPSSGSMTTSGQFLSSIAIRTSNLENIEVVLEAEGDEVPGIKKVEFKKLKIEDFNWTPLDAPEGPDRVYSITFQDQRWRLQKGGVYGYFNKVLRIKDKLELLTTTLDSSEEPWTYISLIKKISKDAGVPIEDPRASATEIAVSAGPQITIDFNSYNRLDELVLNKEYHGESPADVIAEILQEIGMTLSIMPRGEIIIVPITGTVLIPPLQGKSRGADSTAGAKYRPIPDRVYLVGGRVRDQIKIEPNLTKFDWIKSRYNSGMSDDISSALMTTEGLPDIQSEDYGLEPVCPDITGRIRDFYDLIEKWNLTFVDIAKVYQAHTGTPSPKSTPWEYVLSGCTDDASEEMESEQLAKRTLRDIKKTVDDYVRAEQEIPSSVLDEQYGAATALKEATRALRAKLNGIANKREAGARASLYPEEIEFLSDHPDFNVLEEKCNIARQFFFKMYQVPKKVKVKYDWSEDSLAKIKSDLVPDAPEGPQTLDRSYILPMIDVIDETRDLPGEDEEEEEESQSHKGESKTEKLQRLKRRFRLDYQKQTSKERIRARFWCYNYIKVAEGIFSFDFKDFKEISSKTVNLIPELGIVLFHRAPYALGDYAGWSEDCPLVFKACPIGAEFTYERKDPRLGVLNFFIYELEKPSDIKGSPPARKKGQNWLIEYEQIDEFVEHLKQGVSLDRLDLIGVAKVFADEIWKKRVGVEASRAETLVPAPINSFPIGPLQSVTWRTSPFSTVFEVNTDYQRFVGSTLTDKIKRALKEKGIWHRTETPDQHLSERRGFYSLPHTERFQDDERRILINTPHFGTSIIYDPDEDEDVIAVSARLKDPVTHTHLKWWLGPLLCREPQGTSPATYLADWIPLFGHFWWADSGSDRCPYGHSHKIGGFYFPYVYFPPGGYPEPPIIKNPVEDQEELFPRTVFLASELSGATDSKQKAEKWEDIPPPTPPQRENWKANPRTTPRDMDGNSFQAGILVEYCVGEEIADSASSATYSIDWQLISKDQQFDSGGASPYSSGSGEYVLPLPIAPAWTMHRHQLFPIGSVGAVSDYDEFIAEVQRSYGAIEDLFRHPIYITAVKWVWGWSESTPQASTLAPM